MASRLIALPKANSDVRPIAIGEVLRRVTARATCTQMAGSFSSYFSSSQHGIATPGGVELIFHHISVLMETIPSLSILSTDVKNAFNSVCRDNILSETKLKFPELLGYAKQMYRSSSTLIYTKDKMVVKLLSEEGLHQSDPLGLILFAAALHPILIKTQCHHPNTTILAYLDDVYVVGMPDEVVATLSDLTASLQQIGLTIQEDKCNLYFPMTSEDSSTDIYMSKDGINVLGAPIGTPDYVKLQCIEAASRGNVLTSKINELDDPRCSLLLLKHCHVPTLNFLSRTVSPENLLPSAVIHDCLTKDCFHNILNLNQLDYVSWYQATLKVKLGGFGLTSTESFNIYKNNKELNINLHDFKNTQQTYAAVVAEAHPHRVRELMAYLRMIVPEAQRHGGDGWRSYDVLFRKIAAANFALRWGSHYRRYTPHRFWQLGHQQRLRERTAAKMTDSDILVLRFVRPGALLLGLPW
ncbi:uncharacterized protein LOC134189238 [Corticium candelabrum]|uniref:uncharacterized protein LOC134189238 n=1 Tax=Corticium candelabrum TaxID=121492 RepID=UPI002E2598A1|nr:uncharacterized protein LOC134189238 [Corticium candelabrum]